VKREYNLRDFISFLVIIIEQDTLVEMFDEQR